MSMWRILFWPEIWIPLLLLVLAPRAHAQGSTIVFSYPYTEITGGPEFSQVVGEWTGGDYETYGYPCNGEEFGDDAMNGHGETTPAISLQITYCGSGGTVTYYNQGSGVYSTVAPVNQVSTTVGVTNTSSTPLTYFVGISYPGYTNTDAEQFSLMPGGSTTVTMQESTNFSYAIVSGPVGGSGDDGPGLTAVTNGNVSGSTIVPGGTPTGASITNLASATNTNAPNQGTASANTQAILNDANQNAAAIVSAVNASGASVGNGGFTSNSVGILTNAAVANVVADTNMESTLTNLDSFMQNSNYAIPSALGINTGITNSAYSFSVPTIGSASPSVDVPFTALNDYLPAGGPTFTDATLDWSTLSFWASYIANFRAFLLFLITVGFVFLCLRTLRGGAPS